MLNALRHQRLWHLPTVSSGSFSVMCSTPCGIRGYGIAQALLFPSCICRAQRLAASEVMAFSGSLSCSAIPAVLNALRHQRLWHFPGIDSLNDLVSCSTPCGIRGYGICELPSISVRKFSVLNALRHQRLWHVMYLLTPARGR